MRSPEQNWKGLMRGAESASSIAVLVEGFHPTCGATAVDVNTPAREPRADRGVPGTIPSLNGVRGLSFLIVYVAHAGLDRLVPGRFGVNIFFLLSGYLITTLLIREHAQSGSISLKLFYMRRALRILPPMYATYAGVCLFLWATRSFPRVTGLGVLSQLFYFQNYNFHGGILPSVGVLWSLAVEEHFYLFFPPLMILLLGTVKDYGRIAGLLLALCGLVLMWRCSVVAWMPDGLTWARDASDTRADSILFGCVLACFQQTAACDRVFSRRRLETLFVAAGLVVLVLTFVIRNPVFRETLRYTLQGLAIGPLLFYVLRYPQTAIGRFLNLRWVSYLGILSYSLYLLHMAVLLEVGKRVSNELAVGLASLPLAILLAWLMRVFIEHPMEKLRGRFRKTPDAVVERDRSHDGLKLVS